MASKKERGIALSGKKTDYVSPERLVKDYREKQKSYTLYKRAVQIVASPTSRSTSCPLPRLVRPPSATLGRSRNCPRTESYSWSESSSTFLHFSLSLAVCSLPLR